MINKKIHAAFYSAIENSSILPVAYPNVEFSGSPPFLDCTMLPAETDSAGLNIDIHTGLFQCSVVVEIGEGEIDALDYADQILALFPRNTSFTYDGIKIWLEMSGYVSAGVIGGNKYSLPVTIPYKVLN